ncbi:hypothetical protein ABT294_50500 [Nonomuraea sp. NPDC000554]|uniref:hypothetical protein n=1 Tax=Nonomuraea sp. NPDC000554 TaxID=3154259 RepID=UPI00332C458A
MLPRTAAQAILQERVEEADAPEFVARVGVECGEAQQQLLHQVDLGSNCIHSGAETRF